MRSAATDLAKSGRGGVWGLAVLLALALTRPAAAAPVVVRVPESATHGFLVLRGANSDVLAHGEFVQAPKGQRSESRLVFRFKDGSLWDETVTFTQERVFRLMTYPHVQSGPSFPAATDVAFDRDTGRYRARVGDGKTSEDAIELPEDLHNGITGALLKNLPAGASATGHMLAFTPKPYRLETTLRSEGEDKFFVGDVARTATRYLVKMELRGLTGVVASILGKDPPQVRYWISGPPPPFRKFEGPRGHDRVSCARRCPPPRRPADGAAPRHSRRRSPSPSPRTRRRNRGRRSPAARARSPRSPPSSGRARGAPGSDRALTPHRRRVRAAPRPSA